MNPIHAHEIFGLIEEKGPLADLGQLERMLSDTYGPAANFTNCTGNIYSAAEIVQFLMSRNKLVCDSQGVRLNLGEVC